MRKSFFDYVLDKDNSKKILLIICHIFLIMSLFSSKVFDPLQGDQIKTASEPGIHFHLFVYLKKFRLCIINPYQNMIYTIYFQILNTSNVSFEEKTRAFTAN